MLAELTPQFAWYVARSSGIIAWSMCTASIVWGLALSSRLVRRRGIPAWLLDLHRFLGVLSVIFTGIHLFGLWADNFLVFTWREFAIPMASKWRPGAITWGVVATYLLVAIQLTSWAMRKLPRKLWHAIHMTSFPLFIMATVHGFQAGTDRANLLVQWLSLDGAIIVGFLVAYRLGSVDRSAKRRKKAASAPASSGPRRVPVVAD